jgi:hypothetical protein
MVHANTARRLARPSRWNGMSQARLGGDYRHGQFMRTDDLFPSIPFFA